MPEPTLRATWRIDVQPSAAAPPRGPVQQTSRLLFVHGTLNAAAVRRLAATLLADPITETLRITPPGDAPPPPTEPTGPVVEVTLLPGVTDPVAENLRRAAHRLGIDGLAQAATGQRYVLAPGTDQARAAQLATTHLCNPVIQRFTLDAPIAPPFVEAHPSDRSVETMPVRAATDEELEQMSRARRLALNLAEMQTIRGYFLREQRDPTDAELEMLAQTWSEHCVHKTFKATIAYTDESGPEPVTTTIPGLLATYIRAATEQLAKPWVRSAFVDNAGILAFSEGWDVAFKVETHNHPSALEPFGGANTGVGGVVRDVLGVSARPIANTNVLCFAPPDTPAEALPAGVLPPARVAAGVIHGIEDYGNKMGIPTVNGAIVYDAGYAANPLVFCGCLGLLPHGSHPTAAQTDDLIVVLGGRTGRDGLRGATFSSMEMDETTSTTAGSAVQIGHPINEKQVQEVLLRARDERLYHAITDCGAGGLSSAVGEMGAKLGAEVQLAQVPLKYSGLRPWEIWLSEAQERMVLAVPPAHWERLQQLCAAHDTEAVVIGSFAQTGRLRLTYEDVLVGDVAMDFLHDGLPARTLTARYTPPAPPALPAPPTDLGAHLLALLADPNTRSREDTIRRYDHEVQGGTAAKPLVGVADHGPGDAAVLVPLDTWQATGSDPQRGLALSVGICPQLAAHDPLLLAHAAVDEALRNAVAVGADPDQIALLDNFCWGSPTNPERLGTLVRCAQGCYEAALAYGAPFVSGKDSLNNEYTAPDGRRLAIPGTLLISAVGMVPDVRRSVTMDAKQVGNRLYIVGHTSAVPCPLAEPLPLLRALHKAIADGLVQSCHDCSEGGLGVALAELCLAGRLGAAVGLDALPAEELPPGVRLFAEALSRFVVEVRPDDAPAFEAALAGVPHAVLGHLTADATLTIAAEGHTLLALPVATLERAWRGDLPLAEPAPLPPAAPAALPPVMPALRRVPRVLVLHASGTNRDREAAWACELAGGAPQIVHVNELLAGMHYLTDYHMLVLPGGFSYGDDLGAGTLWALDVHERLGADMRRFVKSGRPVLGICNGFQALVKAGLLPGGAPDAPRPLTLAPNESARFECRWVTLEPTAHSPCVFTRDLDGPIVCPVAHGEGRVVLRRPTLLDKLERTGLVALRYATPPDGPAYPANPNGSTDDIAGLCNTAGNVLGLMPHPEDHIFPWQHPRWRRGEQGYSGLRLFINGMRAAQE